MALFGITILEPTYWLSSDGPFGNIILPTMLAVIFIESGVFFPLLPGDSLLFTAGLLAVSDTPFAPLWLILILAPIAAFLGDQVGFYIGHKWGDRIMRKPDGRIIKKKYIHESQEFFDKYGPVTVILCRFVPIVRTYAPLVAGISGMKYPKFILFNAIGAILWGAGVTALGALLGQIEFVRENIDAIFLLIVFVSVLPIISAMVQKFRSARRGEGDGDETESNDENAKSNDDALTLNSATREGSADVAAPTEPGNTSPHA